MRIDRINIYGIKLPFAGSFSHALKKEAFSKNIIVEITAETDHLTAYGEGAPRPYVTGETQDSAIENFGFLMQQGAFPWDLEDVSQIWNFTDSLPKKKKYNSVVCAIEMALLDTLGKFQNRPAIEYFPTTFATDTIYYGAAVHLGSTEKMTRICELIQHLGIRQIRVKMDDQFEKNQKAMETIRSKLGADCDLRIDVNGAWNSKLALKHVPLILKHPVRIVEQPLMPRADGLSDFAAVMKTNGIILMADESVCTLKDVDTILTQGDYEMVNVRLSKCGGFRRSLEMIAYLRATGLSFQIGCQLGESGILSAAGRILCLLNHDSQYYDGSYDNFLLQKNLTEENVTFGPGGMAGPLKGPGLGVQINNGYLADLNQGLARKAVSRP
jgi:L-Ala-D/L-Glu epimerase